MADGNALQKWFQHIEQTGEDVTFGQHAAAAPDIQAVASNVNNIQDALFGLYPPGNAYGAVTPNPGATGLIGNINQQLGLTISNNQALYSSSSGLQTISENVSTVKTGVGGQSVDGFIGEIIGQLQGTPFLSVAPGLDWDQGLSYASLMGQVMSSYGCMRSNQNPNFLITVVDQDASGDPPYIYNFPLMDPRYKDDIDESDYAQAVRLYPTYAWQAHFSGGPFVGCVVGTNPESVVYYIYAPRAPTLAEWFHLWDYTPSSGPPIRNAITDFIRVLTVIPFQY